MEVVISIVMAILISFYTYLSKLQKGQAFEPQKMLRTAITGLVLGVVAFFSGFKITPENWEAYVLSNGMIIGIIDQALKVGWRGIKLLRNNV